jgi:hypothetical protein
MTFSSRPMITKLLKKYDIPLKTVTRTNNGAHVYGYRKYGRTSVPLKKEQKIISLIKLYRQKKYSYKRIADVLNEKQVKTKKSIGTWHPKVISQVLKRI